MINKKGAAYGKDFALGIIILVVFFIILIGGGFSAILKVTSALKSLPTPVWFFIGGFILIKLFSGGKR